MTSYTVPAIVGKMGSTSYYQAVMRADELAATVHAAMDFKEFDTFMASERMQRALSEERVEQEIVPYLTNSADRFFGSIIVLVYKPDRFVFEPLKDLINANFKGQLRGYDAALGALTIDGGMLFALDGQHRLHALRTVINETRTPRLGLPIEGAFKKDVKNDQLSVIFLEYESTEKARRVFNKVNRYAKPTSKSTNILTSEDDGYAIIARCIASLDDPSKFDSDVASPIPFRYGNGKEVLNTSSKTINVNDAYFSTIDTIYSTIEAICKATQQPSLDEKTTIVRPTDDVLRDAYDACARWWGELMMNFTPFVNAFINPQIAIDARREWSEGSVAYRPIGQTALIGGLMAAHAKSGASPSVLVKRLNRIPLALDHDIWQGIIVGGGDVRRKMISRNSALAADLVMYLLLGPDGIGARRTEDLQNRYIEAKRDIGLDRRKLPQAVV